MLNLYKWKGKHIASGNFFSKSIETKKEKEKPSKVKYTFHLITARRYSVEATVSIKAQQKIPGHLQSFI